MSKTDKSLAVKYRPKTFDDLVEQDCIKAILLNQLKTNTTKQSYLFCGPAGDGKTTSARIFANEINRGKGKPIEIDAASNNGVDDVRQIIEDSKRKPLDSDYKVFIMDECHQFSLGAHNAMLKLLEEPPKTAIFIMCTTDPQKIPNTILSRVQRFDFSKISTNGIFNRLKYICDTENKVRDRKDKIQYVDESLKLIANYAAGGMRNAITMLDKCISLNTKLTVENVVEAIGTVDYDTCSDLLRYLNLTSEKDISLAISIIDDIYSSGVDLRQFFKTFQGFVIDVINVKLFKSFDNTILPETDEMLNIINTFDYNECADILDLIIDINSNVRWETDIKNYIKGRIIVYLSKINLYNEHKGNGQG